MNKLRFLVSLVFLASHAALAEEPAAAKPVDDQAAKIDKAAADAIEGYLTDKGFRAIKDDYLVPASPAFAVLGVTGDNVIRPSTPKEFGAALLNGIDPKGTLQSGVAIAFSPHILFGTSKISLQEYRDNPWRRALARTEVSLATTRAASDADRTVRVAVGVRTVLLDRGDIRWNEDFGKFADQKLHTFAVDALKKVKNTYDAGMCRITVEDAKNAKSYLNLVGRDICPPAPVDLMIEPGTSMDAVRERNGVEKTIRQIILESLSRPPEAVLVTDQIDAEWSEAVEKYKDRHWNATNVTIGGAYTASALTGNFGDLGKPGYAAYITGAYGFEDMPGSGLDTNAHIIAHFRYQTRQLVTAVTAGTTPYTQDLMTVGTQVRFRGPELTGGKDGRSLVFFGEFDYQRATPKGMAKQTTYRYVAGADIALTDEVHLQLSSGKETGSATKRAATFVLGDIKYSF